MFACMNLSISISYIFLFFGLDSFFHLPFVNLYSHFSLFLFHMRVCIDSFHKQEERESKNKRRMREREKRLKGKREVLTNPNSNPIQSRRAPHTQHINRDNGLEELVPAAAVCGTVGVGREDALPLCCSSSVCR